MNTYTNAMTSTAPHIPAATSAITTLTHMTTTTTAAAVQYWITNRANWKTWDFGSQIIRGQKGPGLFCGNFINFN